MTHPAAAQIVDLYERTAAEWDRIRGGSRDPFERPWLERFIALVKPGGRVLDIGCGSGEPIARFLLDKGAVAVSGVDSSPALIRICQDKFPQSLYPQSSWRVGDMRTMDLGQFDGLLAWHSFFHLSPEDQRATIPVFARHAAIGAPLMFTSGSRAGDMLADWQGEPLYHGSLDPGEYRSLLEAHGFVDVDHVAEDPDAGAATIWLCRKG